MSCFNPKLAVQYKHGEKLKFLGRVDLSFKKALDLYGDSLKLIPCGQCQACILQRTRDWSTRCYLESLDHKDNCFITLTFDAQHLKKLERKDMSEFIERLRDEGFKLSYFGIGEFGETTGRPHYHMCLFGYCPDDLKEYQLNELGQMTYTSEKLSKIWGQGFVVVGELTKDSASYVARYSLKKIGDLHNVLVCSTRPAIGFNYYQRNKSRILQQVLHKNKIILKNGEKLTLPRYYYKLLQKDFPEFIDEMVNVRSNDLIRSIIADMRKHNDETLFRTQDDNNEIYKQRRKSLLKRKKV